MLRSIVICLTLLCGPLSAETIPTSAGPVRITKVAGGFDEPWGLAFLPDGGFLVTERGGRLTLIDAAGDRRRVTGVPRVRETGQGGLLDVMVPRDFPDSRQVFLSFATRQGFGSGTALGVGQLSVDGTRLDGFRTIFEMSPGSSGGRHFGSRIVEARDGTLFLTIGERGDREAAQDLGRHNGSIIRINRDGSVPADNPFVGVDGARPEIWSYGHRNPQGAALDAAGQLWAVEHGAQGGDEVNRIDRGGNYGWPIIAYGRHYSGAKIGEGTHKPGMEQPRYVWDPSIAPSGLLVYSGRMWPEWKGDIFVGSLKFHYISRLDTQGDWHEERLQSAETVRVRDIREAADGSIWFLSVGAGAVFRMETQ